MREVSAEVGKGPEHDILVRFRLGSHCDELPTSLWLSLDRPPAVGLEIGYRDHVLALVDRDPAGVWVAICVEPRYHDGAGEPGQSPPDRR